MSNSELRSEKIRKARSINDILHVIKDIAFANDAARTSVSRQVSTSAGKSKVAEPEMIFMDHTARAPKSGVKKGVAAPKPAGSVLEKYKQPNVALVKKHSKTLHMLHENAMDIDTIIAKLEHTFANAKSSAAALRSAKSVQKETHKAYGEVASALNAIANKHVPEVLHDFGQSLQEKLIDLLDASQYSNIELELYVNANDAEPNPAEVDALKRAVDKAKADAAAAKAALAKAKTKTVSDDGYSSIEEKKVTLTRLNTAAKAKAELVVEAEAELAGAHEVELEFCYYAVVKDLVLSDASSDHPIEEYSFILTGLVKNNRIRYFFNAVPEFLPPGKYPLGKEVKSVEEMEQRLKVLLGIHGVVNKMNRKPMPYDKNSNKVQSIKQLKNVVEADVKNDTLLVYVNTKTANSDSDANITEIVKHVMPLITPLSGNRKTSSTRAQYTVHRVKERKVGNEVIPRKTYIKFTLVAKGVRKQGEKELSVTTDQLKDLKTQLGLTDKETSEIKKVLIKHRG